MSKPREHTELDYAKAKPNRFADKLSNSTLILLEPDVALAFPTSEAVNEVLRLVMKLSKIPQLK